VRAETKISAPAAKTAAMAWPVSHFARYEAQSAGSVAAVQLSTAAFTGALNMKNASSITT